ncbi:MAG: S8 family serine peptidase [Caulobacter sp.]|nr:S8 family serine peptidase [Caulobacter sp.]
MSEPSNRRRRGAIVAVLVALLAAPAAAQLPATPGLPGIPGGLPEPGDLPLDPSLPSARDATGDLGRVTDLRRLRVRELIRRNRDQIDVDGAGAPVVRGEVLAVAPGAESLARAKAAGFTILRETMVEGAEVRLVTLAIPRGLDARRAIKRLRKADPGGDYDYNHIYSGAGEIEAAAPSACQSPPPYFAGRGGGGGRRIGLVDTGVDAGHPALAGARIEQRGFAPGGVRPKAHGTAAASLLVGRAGPFIGAAPGSALLVADVYGGGPTGGSADAIVRGMGWLASANVSVINVSLVGPPNAALRAVIASLAARGVLIVAAVGNDGPAAPPLYPASYPEVIAVTGVDGRDRVLLEAGRASHLDFAAPGADMAAAGSGGGFVAVRGTSFASPIVAGRLAVLRSAPGPAGARAAVGALARQARDLGPAGPDRIYGRGLVGAEIRTSPRAAGARGGVLR